MTEAGHQGGEMEAGGATWRKRVASTDAPLAARRGSGAARKSGAVEREGQLGERELKQIEKEFPEGLTSVQVVDEFTRRGIRFSEATFRKYVQQGLVPRSRRVGRKGKHQGSMGLYPPTTVRRIHLVKQLMAENHTIEDIQRRVLRFRDDVENVARSCQVLFDGFESELEREGLDAGERRALEKELAEARKTGEQLVNRIENIERRLGRTQTDRPSVAPGGAEDLL
jgi:DNA-binding transcriptional MerR regulator